MSTLILLLALLWVSSASAYTCTGDSCTLDLEFTEPTATDLKDHVWTYQKVGGPAQTVTIPATNPKGGGKIATKTAPQTIPVGTSATFTGTLVSRTKSGAVSTAVPMSVTVVR
jgi:hypothetical protein